MSGNKFHKNWLSSLAAACLQQKKDGDIKQLKGSFFQITIAKFSKKSTSGLNRVPEQRRPVELSLSHGNRWVWTNGGMVISSGKT